MQKTLDGTLCVAHRWLTVALLCLTFFLAPVVQNETHGAVALLEAELAVAEQAIHGHAHGSSGHNAADHEHVSPAIPTQSSRLGFAASGAPAPWLIVGEFGRGIFPDGPRRPPRLS